jgi:hypothetical protein
MTDRVYTNLTITSGSLITKNVQISNGLTCSNINASNVTIGNLIVTGSTITVNVTEQNVVDTNITTGSLNATGITAGNINFTGSLTQNGAVYAPSTSLKGFQVSAATSGNTIVNFISNSYYSGDGRSWVYRPTITYMRGSAYGGGKWVAVGQISGNSTSTIAYSYDGITWTGLGTSIFSDQGYGVAYSSTLSRWVAVGNGTNSIAYSSDGITWTGLGKSTFASYGRGVAYSSALSRWVAVGRDTNSIAYSTDGITWSGVGTGIFSSAGGYGVAYNGSNMWVAVGYGTNSIAFSSDGMNWNSATGKSIFSTNGNGVAYGDGKWVAVGEGTNSVAYSSDGINWTGLGNIMSSIVSRVIYSSVFSRWVSGTGYYSSDGITWTLGGNDDGVSSNESASTNLVVTGQRVQYDTNSNYNNTTGTFTAPSSGIYTINLTSYSTCYITSANTFIPTSGNYTMNAYISAGNTLKCIVPGGIMYNWGVTYL